MRWASSNRVGFVITRPPGGPGSSRPRSSSRGGPADADTAPDRGGAAGGPRRHRTRCLTASNPIAPRRTASWTAPRTSSSRKSSRSRNTCTYSRVPGLPSRASKRRRSRRNSSRQCPPDQRRRLIERARLALQQGQVVSRLEDQFLPPVATPMPGDLLTPAHDHDVVDVAFHDHRPVAVGGRHRVVIAAVAHQRQRRDPRRALVAGVVRDRR